MGVVPPLNAETAKFHLPPFPQFFFPLDAVIATQNIMPRNRGGRPTLSQGLDREVNFAILT